LLRVWSGNPSWREASSLVGNRSLGSEQRRGGEALAMSDQRVVQVAEVRAALQPPRLHHGQHPLHEPAPRRALAPEGVLPPQHATAQHPLRPGQLRRLVRLIKPSSGGLWSRTPVPSDRPRSLYDFLYQPTDRCFHRGSSSRVVKLRDTSSPDRIGKWTAACPMLAVRAVGRCMVTGVFFEKRRSTPWR
jgi:hypothetical protein